MKSNQETPHESWSLGSDLIREQANPEEDQWLSHQFRRIPFLLYQSWLILNFPIILISEAQIIYYWVLEVLGVSLPENETRLGIGFVFFLSGSCQIIYAIRRKKSRVAQKAFLKFQYALICSVTHSIASLRLCG